MRKVLRVLLVAIALLGLQAAAHSATLQAGWYVDIYGTRRYVELGLGPSEHLLLVRIIFPADISLHLSGQYGPFQRQLPRLAVDTEDDILDYSAQRLRQARPIA